MLLIHHLWIRHLYFVKSPVRFLVTKTRSALHGGMIQRAISLHTFLSPPLLCSHHLLLLFPKETCISSTPVQQETSASVWSDYTGRPPRGGEYCMSTEVWTNNMRGQNDVSRHYEWKLLIYFKTIAAITWTLDGRSACGVAGRSFLEKRSRKNNFAPNTETFSRPFSRKRNTTNNEGRWRMFVANCSRADT